MPLFGIPWTEAARGLLRNRYPSFISIMDRRLDAVLQLFAEHLRLHFVCGTYQVSHVCAEHPGVLQEILTSCRSTITTVTETSYDTVETVTVPQTTAFTTITDTPPSGGILHKRQANTSSVPLLIAPVPIIATATGNDPIVTNFPSIAQNASLAAEAYSACSCLRLTTSTITTQPSIQIV